MASDLDTTTHPAQSLDLLADQVERAAGVILRLKEQNLRLQELLHEAERRSDALETELAERPEVDLRPEVERLLAQQAVWQTEREQWSAASARWESERRTWEAERQNAETERQRWETERLNRESERQNWQAERRSIAQRIEQLVQKLEGLAL